MRMRIGMLASAAILAGVGVAQAWEAADSGGRTRHFVNGEIDLNLRAWPSNVSQILARIPQGTRMEADRCIKPAGLTDDWCHVRLGAYVGWVDAAFLQEPGRTDHTASRGPPGYAYTGPVQLTPPQDQYQPAQEQEPEPQRPPTQTPLQSALPGCNDADIAIKAAQLTMGGAASHGITDILVVGSSQALRINNMDGSKVCRVNFRADIDKARELEKWMTGKHPLTELAYDANQAYDAGRPMHVTYSIQPNGEGGYHFSVVNE